MKLKFFDFVFVLSTFEKNRRNKKFLKIFLHPETSIKINFLIANRLTEPLSVTNSLVGINWRNMQKKLQDAVGLIPEKERIAFFHDLPIMNRLY